MIAAALLMLSASWAWSAVTISWTDATGPQSVALTNITNPNWAHDLDNQEQQYCWSGAIDVAMATFPIQFNVTGNFIGANGQLWNQVRMQLNVTNQIPAAPQNWDKFYIEIVGSDGKIYNPFLLHANWNWVNATSAAGEFASSASAYNILPTQVLSAGVKFWANVDPGTGNGVLTFTGRPNCVP